MTCAKSMHFSAPETSSKYKSWLDSETHALGHHTLFEKIQAEMSVPLFVISILFHLHILSFETPCMTTTAIFIKSVMPRDTVVELHLGGCHKRAL